MAKANCFLALGLGLLVAMPAAGHAAANSAAHTPLAQNGASGVALYAQHCGACHDVPSRSLDEAPPLVGPEFEAKWAKRPAALFKKIRFSMPQDNPGTLTDAQANALVAALLKHQISGKAPVKHHTPASQP